MENMTYMQHLCCLTPNIINLSLSDSYNRLNPYTVYMKTMLANADEHLPRSFFTPLLALGRAYQFPPGWSSTMCQEDITAALYPLCDSVIPSALQQCLQNSDSLHVHVATLHWGRVICQVFCAFT